MAAAPFVWLADWKGRRPTIFIGCLGVCIGSVITATSPTLGGFIAGRFLLSFFSTIAATAAPLYLIEIAPPQYRGTMAGMYNTLYYFVSDCLSFQTLRLLILPGLDPRHGDCVCLEPPLDRQWHHCVASGVVAADDLPGNCLLRRVVLP